MEGIMIDIRSHHYFVSYWWQVPGTDRHGFGSTTTEMAGPVRSRANLLDMHLQILSEDAIAPDATVAILNFIRLDA